VRGPTSNELRWPLWSWRNLAVTAATVLLVLYLMGHVIEPAKITMAGAHEPTATTSPTLSSPTPSDSSAARPLPVQTAAPETKVWSQSVSASKSESATRVAEAFAQAWSSSGRSPQEWTRGIQPFVTRALATGLAQTDPAHVPATRVSGEALLMTASATSARIRVPTDGGAIVVTLTRGTSRPWEVSDVAPADQPPGAPTPDLQPAPKPSEG
jgi:hypothetical protein